MTCISPVFASVFVFFVSVFVALPYSCKSEQIIDQFFDCVFASAHCESPFSIIQRSVITCILPVFVSVFEAPPYSTTEQQKWTDYRLIVFLCTTSLALFNHLNSCHHLYFPCSVFVSAFESVFAAPPYSSKSERIIDRLSFCENAMRVGLFNHSPPCHHDQCHHHCTSQQRPSYCQRSIQKI